MKVEDLIQRSALARVSKDEAAVLEHGLVSSRFLHANRYPRCSKRHGGA
jgi:hypothetical protein